MPGALDSTKDSSLNLKKREKRSQPPMKLQFSHPLEEPLLDTKLETEQQNEIILK